MRANGDRAKKLIVAFHFQLGNKAGWSCDDCRKNGLEKRRRCGWLADQCGSGVGIVWARGRHTISSCPTSYVSAESLVLLEAFHTWKLFGADGFYDLPARVVEAISLLENELTAELRDSQQ